jgi:unsaturated chondroitin disaccharide hydrolase
MIVAAAASLDQRFDEGGIPVGAIRSLDDYLSPYPVYIDGMMNLELLFEGWNASGRPSSGAAFAWYQHAVASAVTTMEQNDRANGSTYHLVQHDDGTLGTPPDGMIYDKISDQGYAAETTWSRGQAWALYGFTMVYRYTRDDPSASPERFLSTAKATADYFLDHLPAVYAADPYDYAPGDFVPPTDFDAALGEPVGPYNHDAPKPGLHTFTGRDSSAAAAAASGLLELGTLVSTEAERARYIGAARQILASLLAFARDGAGSPTYLATRSPHRGILAEGSIAWGAAEGSMVFGDYYFLEALGRDLALETGGEVVSTR